MMVSLLAEFLLRLHSLWVLYFGKAAKRTNFDRPRLSCGKKSCAHANQVGRIVSGSALFLERRQKMAKASHNWPVLAKLAYCSNLASVSGVK